MPPALGSQRSAEEVFDPDEIPVAPLEGEPPGLHSAVP